jgi:predicted transcriptional regulator
MPKHSQDTQKRMLRYIAENPLISLRELAAKELITCSLATVNYHVAELIEAGYLKRDHKQRRGFTVTPKGLAFIEAEAVVCKCCGKLYLKLLDRN